MVFDIDGKLNRRKTTARLSHMFHIHLPMISTVGWLFCFPVIEYTGVGSLLIIKGRKEENERIGDKRNIRFDRPQDDSHMSFTYKEKGEKRNT